MPLPFHRTIGRLVSFGCIVSACAPATHGAGSSPAERVLVTDTYGTVTRQSALSDRANATFAAPLAKVWPTLAAAYLDIGLDANFADQASGRYGVRGYAFPKSLKGERIGSYFSCGQSITGSLVDAGRVTAEVMTSLSATDDGQTHAVIYVSGSLRRNDGNSSDPIACSSTGKLEEAIRTSIERRLASS